MSILIAASLGSILGIIAGLMPGIGVSTIVISLYLVLLSFDPGQILVFYFCLLASAQYFGSIPAIFLGVAGEASSYPAVIEGHALARRGVGSDAIWFTGIGSFVGSLVGLGILLLAGTFLGTKLAMTTGEMLLVIMIVGLLVCATTKNSWWINMLLIAIAIVFSHVGISVNDTIPYINFGLPWLANGIPYIALAAAMISVKEVMFADLSENSTIEYRARKSIEFVIGAARYKWSMIRGSLVGALGGLVPGVTTIASSHYAYSTEKLINKNKDAAGMHSLVGSESANNSGAITSLLPLLVFGVPITVSEAIVFSILDAKSWSFSAMVPLELFLDYWYIIVAVNVVSLILAVRAAPYLVKIFPKNRTSLSIFVFMTLAVVVYFSAAVTHGSAMFSLAVFLLATAVVAVTPKINYLPLIFWLVIGDTFIESLYRYLQIIGFL